MAGRHLQCLSFAICTNHWLERYRRLGIVFDFDPVSKSYRYDGAAFGEILRRHPRRLEAAEARRRLTATMAAPH